MKIEIAEPGRMTQSGSSLLRLIQNNDMPVLDLLVRESIQNSLDARKIDQKFVEVNYCTGIFDHIGLSRELEGITEPLQQMFAGQECSYLAVRDLNTVGLTGELDYKKVKNNNYGNLLKLIYEICKPQEAEGAGGSWGLGKTVYFRIGIGLVIYYSRIKTDNGYASRLAASLVENEGRPDAMIPVYRGQAKRGIAWWGEETGENITQPITDERYITKFLSLFDLEPYQNDETGTSIIIPYIDKNRLLSNNQIEYEQKGCPCIPYWCHDIESYLSIAVQRWYAPRLNNACYTHGAYLRLRINGQGLSSDRMEPVFQVIQALYNRANHVTGDDILSRTDTDPQTAPTVVYKVLSETTEAGTVSYVKVTDNILRMLPPDNKSEPYMYFNCEIRDEDVNRPTVCFVRKPGMIVSYENGGPWASNIPASAKNEYIIAVFVLHSSVKLKNSSSVQSLEEYIRKSEMADHTSWKDWSEGTYNPRIITKIQNSVNRQISRAFAPETDSSKSKKNSGLGKWLGDMLLPPDGFGKGASPDTKPSHENGSMKKKKAAAFRVESAKIKYLANSLIVPVTLATASNSKISSTGFEMHIDSETGRMDVNEWEETLHIPAPFSIQNCQISISMLDGRLLDAAEILKHSESEKQIEDITFRRIYTHCGTCCGIKISSECSHSFKIQLSVTVQTIRKDIKPVFIFEKERKNG